MTLVLFQTGPAANGELESLKVLLQAMGLVGAVLAGIGGVIGFFLSRYWNNRDREFDRRERALAAKDAEQSKFRDILYESLKWFEGGTQNRSIGIAVVSTSWNAYPAFQPLWLEVLANQAIYLLAASKEGTKAHEHENLRRTMEIIVRERKQLASKTAELLCETLRDKENGAIAEGLTLTKSLKQNIVIWLSGLCAQGTPASITSGRASI